MTGKRLPLHSQRWVGIQHFFELQSKSDYLSLVLRLFGSWVRLTAPVVFPTASHPTGPITIPWAFTPVGHVVPQPQLSFTTVSSCNCLTNLLRPSSKASFKNKLSRFPSLFFHSSNTPIAPCLNFCIYLYYCLPC